MPSSLVLTEGEEVQAVVEGEMFATSTNLIANAIAKLFQGIAAIFGYRKTGQLVITNKRITLEVKGLTCWCIPASGVFKSIPYHGVASVQYGFEAMCCLGLCRKYALTVTQNSGEAWGFWLKGGEAEASGVTNLIIGNMK